MRAVAARARAEQRGERLVEVAERRRQAPDATAPGSSARSRASASCTCTPRLLPSSSCHSSTTTARRCAKRSRQSARDSISDRLSGVVTSAVGQPPVLPRALGGAACRRCARRRSSAAAARRAARASARPVSAASARIGVIHSTSAAAARLGAPPAPERAAGRGTPPRRSCPCRSARARAPLAARVRRPDLVLERERRLALRGEPRADRVERVPGRGETRRACGIIARSADCDNGAMDEARRNGSRSASWSRTGRSGATRATGRASAPCGTTTAA